MPIYFFISGFVFFYNIDFSKKVYLKKIKNRIKSLLIPYLIWNSLATIFRIILCYCHLLPFNGDFNLSFTAILNCFWDRNNCIFPFYLKDVSSDIFPMDTPLWFIRDLMIAVVCTPILYYLLKKFSFVPILLFGAVLVFTNSGHLWQLAMAFTFFSWGAYMSINNKDMLAVFGKFKKSFFILFIILGLSGVIARFYCYDIFAKTKLICSFIGPIVAFNLSVWLITTGKCKANKFMAASAFFIYVSHDFIYKIIIKSMLPGKMRPDESYAESLLMYVLTIIVTTAILLGVFYLLWRYAPRFTKVIIGRR